MPVEKLVVEEALGKLNAQRAPQHAIRLERYQPPGAFTLSFPDRPLPEGECIDQDFSAIQFLLLEERNVSTDLKSGREVDGRFVIDYEVVEWD